MPLPPSPDSPAPDFISTGRIYYPIPHATRLFRYGMLDYEASCCGLEIYKYYPGSVVLMKVDFCFWVQIEGQEPELERQSMDLNEWQKL